MAGRGAQDGLISWSPAQVYCHMPMQLFPYYPIPSTQPSLRLLKGGRFSLHGLVAHSKVLSPQTWAEHIHPELFQLFQTFTTFNSLKDRLHFFSRL
jgi:hypothetical protein